MNRSPGNRLLGLGMLGDDERRDELRSSVVGVIYEAVGHDLDEAVVIIDAHALLARGERQKAARTERVRGAQGQRTGLAAPPAIHT
ncbi:MAG: hypothetical protein HC927_06150 [Deltaproteobacteria bacterium]|nr:hypothetical protein [Deltaproteobacteria bacterium]